MAAYLAKVQEMLHALWRYTIRQVPRQQNCNANALAKLATTKDSKLISVVHVDHLETPSISDTEDISNVEEPSGWMQPIVEYFSSGALPQDKNSARNLLYQIRWYIMKVEILYHRSYSMPLLRCVSNQEVDFILREVHEGFCGDHVGGHSLSKKILRQRYVWLTMNKDALDYVKKCGKCQCFANIPRAAPSELTLMKSLWPFVVWGIDLIGSLPTGEGGVKYSIVVIDYFTKWVEVEPLVAITSKKALDFVIKNIICRYRLPRKIVSDNGLQFDNNLFTEFCQSHGIIKLLIHCPPSIQWASGGGEQNAQVNFEKEVGTS